MTTTWWSDDKIAATVTAEYVARELQTEAHQAALHRPLAFGDGLTDDTYLDWILQKGRRIFLILNHIGCPEWIFDIIDKTFDDDDLPLSEEALWELNLFGGKSETLDKKFYRQQFNFMVQQFQPGGHVDYGDDDVLPLEPMVKRMAGVSSSQACNRVCISDRVYARKKISTSGENGIDRDQFVMHMKALQAIRHPHLVSVWATYTKSSFSYVLLTPTLDLTLKSFLDEQPRAFKNLLKPQRREILLRWTHCLTSALAYLHEKGFTHQAIRPSTVTIDQTFRVYLNDFGALKALDVEGNPSPYNCEIYDHAAPENWTRKPSLHESAPLRTTLPGGGRTTRRLPSEPPRPLNPYPVPGQVRRRSDGTSSCNSSTHSRPQKALITTFAPPRLDSPPSCPADIFSLTTILLHLVSLVLSHSPKSFAAHRSRHNRHAGRGGAPADASFHVNLAQVWKWMDLLNREAAGRHHKDQKRGEEGIWEAVGGIVNVCRGGLKREPAERVDSRDMEREIRGWVDKALGPGRRQCCGEEEEEVEEANGWVDMGLGPKKSASSTHDKGFKSWLHRGSKLKRMGVPQEEVESTQPMVGSREEAEVELMRNSGEKTESSIMGLPGEASVETSEVASVDASVNPSEEASVATSEERSAKASEEGESTLIRASGEDPESLRSMSVASTAISGLTFENPDEDPKTPPQHSSEYFGSNAVQIHKVDEGLQQAEIGVTDPRQLDLIESTAEDGNWPLRKDMELGPTFLMSPGQSMISVGESMISVGGSRSSI
ncbi:hypothetical protein MMC22_011955 [Lobaria immixta]|nr:hypothetical protein [Lobaria immixta]